MTAQQIQQENVAQLAETLKRIDYAAAAKAWRECAASCLVANDINGASFAMLRVVENENRLVEAVS